MRGVQTSHSNPGIAVATYKTLSNRGHQPSTACRLITATDDKDDRQFNGIDHHAGTVHPSSEWPGIEVASSRS
jgi:hypothetical protein